MNARNLLGLLGVLAAGGCASESTPPVITAAQASAPAPVTAPATAPSTQPAGSAFRVREAELPQGFPKPGAVGQVMVKQYPAYRAAVVQAASVDDASQNSMFRRLFGHIERRNIAMTAPVELTYPQPAASQPSSMAFIYGSPSTGQPGSDGDVQVADLPAMTVVSVAVRGGYDAQTYQKGINQLLPWLEAHREYQVAGRPRFLAYNSPFVPGFLKLGEVQIPVTPAGR